MDIAQKYKILEKIMLSEDDELLGESDSLLNTCREDFWTGLPGEVKDAIKKAKSELDIGEGIPHHQVMTEVRERFLK